LGCCKGEADNVSRAVTTIARLERTAHKFKLVHAAGRKFARPAEEGPSIATIACGSWQESSTGDALHKLILVIRGQVDVEGGSGGWLVLPNHMIFVPADRQFNLRTSQDAIVHVAFLEPADHPWHHVGCWVTLAEPLVHEMLAMILRLSHRQPADQAMLRQMFRTLSHLCQEWFSHPKMLWLPAAKSKPTRAFVRHVADHLADATVQSGCAAAGVSQRTLQRLSNEEFSFGLKTLITEVRMMRAMELLSGDRLSVEAVAGEVGYASLSAFTSAFAARLGISPGEYRQQNRRALQTCRELAN
jgi:AraC-like DNA-binding protein